VKRFLSAIVATLLLSSSVYSQGGMGPGPGVKSYSSTPPVDYILTQTLGTLINPAGFDGYLGFRFTTVASPLPVTALCRWKISGNSQTHLVKLYREVDGGAGDVEIGSVSVDLSSGSDASYVCTNLGSPVTMNGSTAHYIYSQETPAGDAVYNDDTTIDSVTADVSSAINFSVYKVGAAGGRSISNGGARTFVPVNFKVQP